MIEITDLASQRIKEILDEEDNPTVKLRVYVQGGGCSGMQYGFDLAEEQNEDDFIFETTTGVSVLIDSISMQYLHGAKIDFKDDLYGSAFSIENPNAETTCGCGSSFSVSDDYTYDELPTT